MKDTEKRKITFEQQQDLNRVRDTAMRTATAGLTTRELQALTPALLRAALPMRDALEELADFDEHGGREGKDHSLLIIYAKRALEQAKEGEKHD